MDDDASMSMRWGGFFESPARNLGLQLMSSVPADRDTKQLLSGSPFLHHHQHVPHHHHHPRDCGGNGNGNGVPNGGAMPPPATEAPPSMPMNFVRNDMWMHPQQQQHHHHHPREHKVLHNLTVGHGSSHIAHHDPVGYGMIPGTHSTHTLQMMQQTEPQPQPPPPPQQPKEECISSPLIEENVPVIDEPPPPKKRQQGRQPKVPRAKKPKKSVAPREDGAPNAPTPRRRGPRKNIGMVINGIDLDLSRIPTPVCSCTGAPQQCYRWGAGGWQSACCTTTISTYPLPMSTKRRGARIAGRKMSHGAFKKVLEKLAGEGYNLNNPIDLKTFWAKHGTNKFVTISSRTVEAIDIHVPAYYCNGQCRCWNVMIQRQEEQSCTYFSFGNISAKEMNSKSRGNARAEKGDPW
uniref:GAGA-binding transcriptional activator n=1 Tax=Oryza punctata TaxID=4537 RepID=A0A0E0KCJ0_ORYPU